MHLRALEILRCPFCGGCLKVDEDCATREFTGLEMSAGILWCECSAFPVVDGIAVLRTGATVKSALELLQAGMAREAKFGLLGKSAVEVGSFEEGVRVFAAGAEGDYLLYRFSDPSFVVSEALLGTVGAAALQVSAAPGPPARVLDACGGTGHLTRMMLGIAGTRLRAEASARQALAAPIEVWLADLEYWKLWLAKRFMAPEAQMVCCDANQPLPFAPKSFGLAFCSDAINYIWQRRLFAAEMLRLTAEDGLTLFTHVHNALCENPSPGMPLSPSGYRQIFEGVAPAFFSESALLESIVGKEVVPLAQSGDVSSAAAMEIMITSRADLLRSYALPFSATTRGVGAHEDARPCGDHGAGEWRVNPLYEMAQNGDNWCLTLKWPNDFYEAEFREAKGYLPEQLTIPANRLASLGSRGRSPSRTEELPADLIPLAKRRVLLDLPKDYMRT